MNHQDHVALLQKANITPGTVWADLGSGEGAFTLAFRDIAGLQSTIYSLDKNKSSLEIQKKEFEKQFPESNIIFLQQDFTEKLELPQLDGIIMANSLHYVQNKAQILEQLLTLLKPGGMFILIEYNVDSGNVWVPFPISFPSFKQLAAEVQLREPTLLHTVSSSFLKEIYSAKAVK